MSLSVYFSVRHKTYFMKWFTFLVLKILFHFFIYLFILARNNSVLTVSLFSMKKLHCYDLKLTVYYRIRWCHFVCCRKRKIFFFRYFFFLAHIGCYRNSHHCNTSSPEAHKFFNILYRSRCHSSDQPFRHSFSIYLLLRFATSAFFLIPFFVRFFFVWFITILQFQEHKMNKRFGNDCRLTFNVQNACLCASLCDFIHIPMYLHARWYVCVCCVCGWSFSLKDLRNVAYSHNRFWHDSKTNISSVPPFLSSPLVRDIRIQMHCHNCPRYTAICNKMKIEKKKYE